MYLPTVASRRGRPHPRGETMRQASVETVCKRLPDTESGVHPDPDGRAWVYMSLCRNKTQGPKTARLAASDSGDECRRGVELLTRQAGRGRVVAGSRAADGTGLPTRQLALRAHVAPASVSVEQLTAERYRRGRRPPDHQPVTHTRLRRFDRPSSVSRPNRTLMATDTSARPSDRTVSDNTSAGRGHR